MTGFFVSVWNDIKSTVAEAIPHLLPGSKNRNEDLTLGQRGELAAARFLAKHGFRVIERGYSNHIGEVDLIAIDLRTKPRTVVFVEVKTRKSDFRGLPIEAVDNNKQRQISGTALVYMKKNDLLNSRIRFDVIGIIWPEISEAPQVSHYRNAFQPTGEGQMFN